MDGGMRTVTNADLAAGADRVLVLFSGSANSPLAALPQSELDALEPAEVLVIQADADSLTAFGPNPLDPSVRHATATAALAQGARLAGTITAFWTRAA